MHERNQPPGVFQPMSDTSSPKVVVFAVDDEQDNLNTLNRALRRDYTVRTFEDAADALEALRTDECDILVTDIKMPSMSGIELARAVRENADRVPIVIVISAFSDTTEVQVAHRDGILDVVLAKPWSPADLQDSLRRAVTFLELRKLAQRP